jgi:predicted nucleic-acid-binding Zn-ribbon protein
MYYLPLMGILNYPCDNGKEVRKVGEKLKQLCRDITDARYKYKVCENCGAIILRSRNSCPKCGRTRTREIQPGDMEREPER